MALAFIPRLVYMGFSLSQPYLVNKTITYISFHKTLPDYYGYGLIGAYGLCYLGIAVGIPNISLKGLGMLTVLSSATVGGCTLHSG